VRYPGAPASSTAGVEIPAETRRIGNRLSFPIANVPFSWHACAMNAIIEPDKQNRIVLTREIRNAAGFQPGEPLQITASPGRIVLEVKPESSGKIIKKGGLKVWTGKVPPIPLDEAVNMSRHYSR
jgi:hypothetical protein